MENFINKKTACLREGTEVLLNQQIAMEAKAVAAYLSMASWCAIHGYKHAAAYCYAQSDEERGHMLRIFHYLSDAGGRALQSDITNIQQDFSSLQEIFELALAQEIKVSYAIHGIAQHCLEQGDMATFNFIQWFIKEQVEEEATVRQILDLFHVIGQTDVGLYLIDKEIGALKGK
jgi:ferritin